MRTPTWPLVATLVLAACSGGSDATPQPTSPTPSPLLVNLTTWNLTQRFVSVTGPDNCWIREQRAVWTGAVFADLPMSIRSSGTSIALEGEFFQVNYAGTLARNDFSASGGPLEGGGSPCEDGTRFTQLPGVSTLTGRFTGDGRNLTAAEVNTYLLDSGGQVKYTWDWVATRVS